MLTNEDRVESLRIFSTLYAPRDFNLMVSRMPQDVNDQDGILFDSYFDFLQSLYALRGDIKTIETEDELDEILMNVFNSCKKFNYPTHMVEGLYYG